MRQSRKHKDYYDFYMNKVSFPSVLGLVIVAICMVAYGVYSLLN